MSCEGPAAPVVSQSYLLQPTPVLFLTRDVTTTWFRKRKVCVKEVDVGREMGKNTLDLQRLLSIELHFAYSFLLTSRRLCPLPLTS